ncbi:MAG: YhjD/YihY/BrkB family envelope integrity protein [Myxococcota bacterium]
MLVFSLLFMAIFKFMPEATTRWADVATGGTVTGVLFTVGKALIGLYLGNSDVGSAYGGASSLAVVLVWVYYSAVIVLFGAEFTSVWTRRYGSACTPEAGAVVQSEHDREQLIEEAIAEGRVRPPEG